MEEEFGWCWLRIKKFRQFLFYECYITMPSLYRTIPELYSHKAAHKTMYVGYIMLLSIVYIDIIDYIGCTCPNTHFQVKPVGIAYFVNYKSCYQQCSTIRAQPFHRRYSETYDVCCTLKYVYFSWFLLWWMIILCVITTLNLTWMTMAIIIHNSLNSGLDTKCTKLKCIQMMIICWLIQSVVVYK